MQIVHSSPSLTSCAPFPSFLWNDAGSGGGLKEGGDIIAVVVAGEDLFGRRDVDEEEPRTALGATGGGVEGMISPRRSSMVGRVVERAGVLEEPSRESRTLTLNGLCGTGGGARAGTAGARYDEDDGAPSGILAGRLGIESGCSFRVDGPSFTVSLAAGE